MANNEMKQERHINNCWHKCDQWLWFTGSSLIMMGFSCPAQVKEASQKANTNHQTIKHGQQIQRVKKQVNAPRNLPYESFSKHGISTKCQSIVFSDGGSWV